MQARRIKCKLFMSIMKNNLQRCFVLLRLFFAAMAAQAQDSDQAKLLRKAFRQNSQEKLEHFFQNWAKEVRLSDTAAANPYVAEAFKLFLAFYQPTTMPKYDTKDYRNSAYFIVQSTLNEIRIHCQQPQSDKLSAIANQLTASPILTVFPTLTVSPILTASPILTVSTTLTV